MKLQKTENNNNNNHTCRNKYIVNKSNKRKR